MDAVELAPKATNAEELVPDSMEAPEEDALDSMDAALEALEELTPEGLTASASLPESLAPEEIVVPESLPDFVPDSMEPESQGTLCKRCNTIHGDNDIVACRLARREASRCECCRVVHRDYDLAARILDDQDKFDCLIYISDVDKLQMSGEIILVPEHVQNKLDEQRKMKKDANKE
ncbi:hypothetical protein GQ55_8G025900 [Panicum hallii var. hallii]|uniref:Uncharacterized protein n=1 Tax=Panicum hallii var. hallii TaxID=1504633 RepID=A0A2T7CK92_9POAL|nr:hypothetical protein GQ55_8G025900 [Panicum hallii var. hallii]